MFNNGKKLSCPVISLVFDSLYNFDLEELCKCSEALLRPVLPCLVRMSVCKPLDLTDDWTLKREQLLRCILGIPAGNSIYNYLSIDFACLEKDLRKEQKLRSKVSGGNDENSTTSLGDLGRALTFEKNDDAGKLRLVLSDVLSLVNEAREGKQEFIVKSSELFENDVYLQEVADILCISHAELPNLLPLSDLAEALLRVENGGWLFCHIIANSPSEFLPACQMLISSCSKDENNTRNGHVIEMLKQLCVMCPSEYLSVRQMCIDSCRLPSLAVTLTLENREGPCEQQTDELISFVSGLLLGNDCDRRNWFAQFIRGSQKGKEHENIVNSLRKDLANSLLTLINSCHGNVLPPHLAVRASAFLRLYCALKSIATIRLNDEETSLLLSLIVMQPPCTAAGVRFVCLALCIVLACPYMLSSADDEIRCIKWIRWLLTEDGYFLKTTGVQSSFGEMLLLIAIHFHSNHNNAIADLVSTTLGMKSVVKANTLARLKTIFVQEIFTEQVMAQHAVRVPVTRNLNAGVSGFLPVHCVFHLIKGRIFSKHKISIKDWIYEQLCESQAPVHDLLPSLIEAFVNSVVTSGSKGEGINEPITEEQLTKIFEEKSVDLSLTDQLKLVSNSRLSSSPSATFSKGSSEAAKDSLTVNLLFLYYVLLYEDILANSLKTSASTQKAVHYSEKFMSQLPIKYLLLQAKARQQDYMGLYPPLLRLLVAHYPHLCIVEDWLSNDSNEILKGIPRLVFPSGLNFNPEGLTQAYQRARNDSSAAILLFLDRLEIIDSDLLMNFAEAIASNLPLLLESEIPRRVLDKTRDVWLRLYLTSPMRLSVLTINVLCGQTMKSLKTTKLTESDITADPLIILRCDERIFRCGPLMTILLRMLSSFLIASRSHLNSQVFVNQVTDAASVQAQNASNLAELRNALIATQESTAVQILLEICMPKDDSEQMCALTDLREVQSLICSCLHQWFIADTNLVKLVHFQGYPIELLPLTVAAIPSMHICINFLPELLTQPSLEKQIFAIQLISHLCVQYALPKFMSIAKLSINIMATYVTVLTSNQRSSFFSTTLPAVSRIARVFPPLHEDIVPFLIQLSRVCSAQLACTDGSDDVGVMATNGVERNAELKDCTRSDQSILLQLVEDTFSDIVASMALLKSEPLVN